MSRDALQRTLAYCGAIVLCAAVMQQYYARGAPYFRAPQTILDHVAEGKHPQRHTLVVVPQFATRIPHGASVTCFQPRNGAFWNDDGNYLTCVGLLPYNELLPPLTAGPYRLGEEMPQYVIAIDEPFRHESFDLIATGRNGWLYRRR